MKKFLLSLLVLIMFTPSLACAGISGMPMGQNDAAPMEGMPCHDMAPEKSTSEQGIMFFKDCAGIDLLGASADMVFKKVDGDKDVHFDIILAAHIPAVFDLPQNHAAHPPPRLYETAQFHLPVFLATQRLRI